MTLKEYRDSKGLRPSFVATAIGVCRKHLNDIENGRVNLTENRADNLSQFYGINVNTIKEMYEEAKNEKFRHSKKASTTS